MTKQEMVTEWVKNNPEPDQNLLPNIYLQWTGNARKYGGEYLNLYDTKTGKKKVITGLEFKDCQLYPHWNNDNTALYRRPLSDGYIMSCAYIKNIPEYGMVELSIATIPVGRPDKMKNVDKRKWEYADANTWYDFGRLGNNRLFLFKEDSVAYNEKSEIAWADQAGKYYNHQVVWFITHQMGHMSTYSCELNRRELSKFVCGSEDSKDCPYNLYHPYWWGDWYKKMQPRQMSERAKKINATIASAGFRDPLDLAKVSPVIVHKKTRTGGGGYTYDNSDAKAKYAFIDKVGDEWIISCYSRKESFDYYAREDALKGMKEGEIKKVENKPFDANPVHIVISKQGKPSVQVFNEVTKQYSVKSCRCESIFGWSDDNYILYDKDNWNDCPYLKFALEQVKKNPESRVIQTIITCLRHPVIQRLNDAGYHNLVRRVLRGDGVNVVIRDEFGILNNSTKASLNEMLGMTNEQLEYFDGQYVTTRDKYGSLVYSSNAILYVMRYLKTMEPTMGDIRSMDFEDFKFLIDVLKEHCNTYAWVREYLVLTSHSYWNFTSDEKFGPLLKKTMLLKRDNPVLFETLRDCISMMNSFKFDNKPPVENIFHYTGETVESAQAFMAKLKVMKELDNLGKTVDWSAYQPTDL